MIQNIGKEGEGLSFFSNLQTMRLTLTNFWYTSSLSHILSILLFISYLSLIGWFIFKKKSSQEKILATIVVFYLFMFIFYPGKILDYYYLGFFPFFAVTSGLFLKRFNHILLLLLGFIFIINSFVNVLHWPTNSGLATKKELIKKTISVIGNNSFYLETNQDYLYFGGWRYLFEAYGKKPASSQADAMFGWIYPKEISSERPKLKVIITDKEIKPDNELIKKISVGQYKSYIISLNKD
jgi:ABC-type multidrug transport system fused ATPase/permease subunit